MEIYYRILKDRNLIIQKFIGDWSNEDFEKSLKTITSDPDWKYVKRGITDLREGNLDQAIDNIEITANLKRKYIKEKLLNILLVDRPLPTAVVHLYIEQFRDKYEYEYCSTVDHVKEKLGLQRSCTEIEYLLNDLACNKIAN